MAWVKDLPVQVGGQDTGVVVPNAYHFANNVTFRFDKGLPKEVLVNLGAYLSKEKMQSGGSPLEEFGFSIMQQRVLELLQMDQEAFLAHTGMTLDEINAGLANPVNLAFAIIARLIYLEALTATNGPGVLKYEGATWSE